MHVEQRERIFVLQNEMHVAKRECQSKSTCTRERSLTSLIRPARRRVIEQNQANAHRDPFRGPSL